MFQTRYASSVAGLARFLEIGEQRSWRQGIGDPRPQRHAPEQTTKLAGHPPTSDMYDAVQLDLRHTVYPTQHIHDRRSINTRRLQSVLPHVVLPRGTPCRRRHAGAAGRGAANE